MKWRNQPENHAHLYNLAVCEKPSFRHGSWLAAILCTDASLVARARGSAYFLPFNPALISLSLRPRCIFSLEMSQQQRLMHASSRKLSVVISSRKFGRIGSPWTSNFRWWTSILQRDAVYIFSLFSKYFTLDYTPDSYIMKINLKIGDVWMTGLNNNLGFKNVILFSFRFKYLRQIDTD